MYKRTKTLSIARATMMLALMLLTTMTARADYWDDDYYYDSTNHIGYNLNKESGTANLNRCDGDISGVVTIPASITNPSTATTYRVTSIGNEAFQDQTDITSLVIGDNVTTIGEYAFFNCSSLTAVTFEGNKVTTIGEYAFYNCGFTSLDIPNSVTTIGEYAFYYCSSLATLTLGSGVTSIGKEAFAVCGITSLDIPNSVTTIGEEAFSSCSSLATLTLGTGLTSIGKGAFQQTGLTALTIPGNVETIGEGAFYDCSSLATLTLGSGVTTIGKEAFADCGITSLVIPNSVTSIGNSAFDGCSALTTLTIGTGVTTIGSKAFYDCRQLPAVTLPCGVTIGSNAFQYCNALKTVNFIGTGTIPEKALGDMSNIETVVIGDGITGIGGSAFDGQTYSNNQSLTTVTIPEGVTTISLNAFRLCSNLTSVNIPNSVTSIGSEAFKRTGLTGSLLLPNSVTTLGADAFNTCTHLTSVTIGSGMTTIGSDAFRGCTNVADVYCHANPAALTWNESYCDDFNYNTMNPYTKTVCHVYDEMAWKDKFGDSVNLDFAGDLLKGKAHDGNYWTTFYDGTLGYEIQAATGGCAYTAEVSGDELTLHRLGRVIPKQTPVIIVSTTENVGMSVSTATVGTMPENDLQGKDVQTKRTDIDGSGSFYVMGKQDDVFGFYEYTAEYMPARKAYLLVNGDAALARGITMVFDDGGATDISTTDFTDYTDGADAWYSLDGRKLSGKPSQRGVYVNNGRKVVIK